VSENVHTPDRPPPPINRIINTQYTQPPTRIALRGKGRGHTTSRCSSTRRSNAPGPSCSQRRHTPAAADESCVCAPHDPGIHRRARSSGLGDPRSRVRRLELLRPPGSWGGLSARGWKLFGGGAKMWRENVARKCGAKTRGKGAPRLLDHKDAPGRWRERVGVGRVRAGGGCSG
jgi:hypothetical protein